MNAGTSGIRALRRCLLRYKNGGFEAPLRMAQRHLLNQSFCFNWQINLV